MTKKTKKVKGNIVKLSEKTEEKKKVKLEMVKKEEVATEYIMRDIKIMRLERTGFFTFGSQKNLGDYGFIPKDKIVNVIRHYQPETRDPKTQIIKANAGFFMIINALGSQPSHFFFEDDIVKRDMVHAAVIKWMDYKPNIWNIAKRVFRFLTGIGTEYKPVELWTKVKVPVVKPEPVQ